MRKYPNHETFAVERASFSLSSSRVSLTESIQKLNRNWIGPLRIQTVLDNTHYLCSDWNGILIPKRFHINRLKQYYMNLSELGKNGQ